MFLVFELIHSEKAHHHIITHHPLSSINFSLKLSSSQRQINHGQTDSRVRTARGDFRDFGGAESWCSRQRPTRDTVRSIPMRATTVCHKLWSCRNDNTFCSNQIANFASNIFWSSALVSLRYLSVFGFCEPSLVS